MTANPTERVPPYSKEAEMCVLGALLLDAQSLIDIEGKLEPGDFYEPAHTTIYRYYAEASKIGQRLDNVLLTELLDQNGELEKVGGRMYIMDLCCAVPTTEHIEHYARIVKEKALLRQLISGASDIVRDAFGTDPPQQVLDRAERTIFEITNRQGRREATPIQHVLKETFDMLESDTDMHGIPSGFHDIDELTNGLHPSELVIIAARPSMGKTTFASNIMRNVAINEHVPVAFFSLEMPKQQVVQNMLCSLARVDAHRMRRKRLEDQDWTALARAGDILHDAPIFIDDEPGASISAIRGKSRRLKAKYDIGLIVIDYLQLVDEEARSRIEQITKISQGLKSLARELEVPVITLSQLSRGPEQRESHKPRMSDLRESGSIEQDADVVMLLFREEYYHPEKEEARNKAEVIVAKNRNGPVGAIQMTFLKSYMRFESFAAGRPGPA